jgi:hypothetical protein
LECLPPMWLAIAERIIGRMARKMVSASVGRMPVMIPAPCVVPVLSNPRCHQFLDVLRNAKAKCCYRVQALRTRCPKTPIKSNQFKFANSNQIKSKTGVHDRESSTHSVGSSRASDDRQVQQMGKQCHS